MNRLLRIVVAATLVATLTGLAAAQGLERTMTIEMGEMYFQVPGQPQNAEIALDVAVPYRITFSNVGTVRHNVKFGSGLITEEGVPFAYADNLFQNVPLKVLGPGGASFRVVTNELLELDLDPGQSVDVIFTLPAERTGTWEIGCFVIGHYEAGMLAPLVVR